MARTKAKGIPPSRKKYEEDNPVVSCRVSKELYNRLRAIKKTEGKSMADILKAGLGLFEVKVRAEKEVRQEAYEEGQLNGYELAESEYKVTYPCSICGKSTEVTTEEEKKAIRRYMVEHGWGHANCINRRR